jgi:ABC-type glycerol-3-phosphate transport system substrate-binding protein
MLFKEKKMKKTALLPAVLVVLSTALLVNSGCQSRASDSQSGLSVIKVWGHNKQITYNNMTTKLSDLYDGTVPSRYWDEFNAQLAKRGLKLDLTLVMNDQWSTAFQSLLASGRLNNYDWVAGPANTDERTRMSLIDQKRLYPVNKAIEQYSGGEARNFYYNTPWGKQYKALETLEDGNFYWVSHNMSSYYKEQSNPLGVAIVGQIRKDWLDKLGLPMPATTEEFYNALAAFRNNDVNQNGVKDEVARVESTSFGRSIAQWYGLGDNLISYIDYTVVSPWYQPNVKEFFTFMNRLYKAGLLVLSNESADMASNRLGFIQDYASEFWNEPNIVVPAGAAKPYYNPLVIEAVKGTSARVYDEEVGYTIYRNSIMCFIPAGSKNIEKAAKLVDYFTSDDYYKLAAYGIEGYSYEIGANGRPSPYASLKNPVARDMLLQLPEELWIIGIVCGFRRNDRDVEYTKVLNYGKENGYANFRTDFFTNYFNKKWPLVMGSPIEAFPTRTEVDRIAAIAPDLNTYSSELISALILGNKKIANWDSYIADLKRLGLDELIAIHQAQVDRGRK